MEKKELIELVNRMSWDSCKLALLQIIGLQWDDWDLGFEDFVEILEDAARWPGKEPAEL
jgi:hypothetical protein